MAAQPFIATRCRATRRRPRSGESGSTESRDDRVYRWTFTCWRPNSVRRKRFRRVYWAQLRSRSAVRRRPVSMRHSSSVEHLCVAAVCAVYVAGGGGVPTAGKTPLAASQRPARHRYPPSGAHPDETSSAVHSRSPSGLPSPVAPGWNGHPWALSRPQHPTVTSDAPRGGDGL